MRYVKKLIPTILGLSLNGMTIVDSLRKYENVHDRFLYIFRDEIRNNELLPRITLPDTIQITKTIPLVTANIDNNKLQNDDSFIDKNARIGSQIAMQFVNNSNSSTIGDGTVAAIATPRGRVIRLTGVDTNQVFLYPGIILGKEIHEDNTKLFILPDETNRVYRADDTEETSFDFEKIKNDKSKNKLNLVHFDTAVPRIIDPKDDPLLSMLPIGKKGMKILTTDYIESGGSYRDLNGFKLENVNNLIENYKCEINCGCFRPFNFFA